MRKFSIYPPLDGYNIPDQVFGVNKDYYASLNLGLTNGHDGYDYICPVGTPIYSKIDGIVRSKYIDTAGAKTIGIITRDCDYDYNGVGCYFMLLYVHLDSFANLDEGDFVKMGDLIGYTGNTGMSQVPHLHLGIYPLSDYSTIIDIHNGFRGAVNPGNYIIDIPKYFRLLGLISQLLDKISTLWKTKTVPDNKYATIGATMPHVEVNTHEVSPKYDWSNPEAARHSVRVICDEEGLSVTKKNILTACIKVESNFDPKAVHYNKGKDGKVWSADWGICQVNDYWNIGPNKPFPSVEYVLDNPEACVRWMVKMFLAGKEKLWASYTNGAYKQYL